MRKYRTVYTEVEVDLSDFETDDLVEELEYRNAWHPTMGNSDELIDKIFHLRRLGKPFERELDEYLYIRTGRAI
jgi:hypothetical protein